MATMLGVKPIMMGLIEAMESMAGYCKACRDWTHDCCEPDARAYKCPQCGGMTVYGAEEAMLMGLVDLSDEEADAW